MMRGSVFSGLLHSLDRGTISQIAAALGESDQRVSRGVEVSIAFVLGVLARSADDLGALRGMLDLPPENLGEVSWPMLASGLTKPASPCTAASNDIGSALFGSSGDTVAGLVGKESGLGPVAAASLWGMAATMSLSLLRRRVREDDLSINDVGAILREESDTIRRALPTDLGAMLWPSSFASAPALPMAAPPVRVERSAAAWTGGLGVALVAFGGLWLASHVHRAGQQPGLAATGSANRMAEEPSLAGTVKRRLAGSSERPVNETESELLGTMSGLDVRGGPSWVSFDSLKFGSGSATLPIGSGGQLDQIAAFLDARPDLDVTIAGSADVAGTSAKNLRLSRARAEAVKRALVARAVSPDRITAQGSGLEGEAASRCVSMRVTRH
jgi:outer membrane protein OmpA-like peptidoglycan-associated protein